MRWCPLASNLEGADALKRRLAAIGDTKVVLGQVALLAVNEAKHIARSTFTKTGNLERTIRVQRVSERDAIISAGGGSRVGYARYVEEGTGLYGPRRRKIVPTNKKMLSWVGGGSRLTGRGKGSGRIFARSVKGRPATPYLVPGAKQAVEKSGVGDTIIKLWDDAA